jgi:hypothetical protein
MNRPKRKSKMISDKDPEPQTPAELLMAEVLARTLGPYPDDESRRRATGLLHPLPFYAHLYSIPLITIKRIHTDPNLSPAALDAPSKLLPILMERRGPKIDLRGMERVVKARFAAGLRDRHEKGK